MVQFVKAVPDQELFLQGNSFFLQGQFSQARQSYENMLHKNSVVWHSIGNCYFNEKNNIKALICWKRAERGASFSQLGQLFKSESIVFEQLGNPYDSFFIRSMKRVLLVFPKMLMQLLLLIFLLSFLMIFYSCFVQKNQSLCKKKYFWLSLGAIIIVLSVLVIKEKQMLYKEAVVLQKTPVFVGPDTTFSQKAILPSGCVVRSLDEKQGMMKVTSLQGSGWIARDAVEII